MIYILHLYALTRKGILHLYTLHLNAPRGSRGCRRGPCTGTRWRAVAAAATAPVSIIIITIISVIISIIISIIIISCST